MNKWRTKIIVDSTTDLMHEFKNRVHVVPLAVNFGTEEHIDRVTIDHTTTVINLLFRYVL